MKLTRLQLKRIIKEAFLKETEAYLEVIPGETTTPQLTPEEAKAAEEYLQSLARSLNPDPDTFQRILDAFRKKAKGED